MATLANQLEQALAEREHLAEDILNNKQLIVDYDRKRNSNREALSKINKTETGNEKKLWIHFGDMFMKLPTPDAKRLVEQEQSTLDDRIEEARKLMKQQTTQLYELEGKSKAMLGFDLVGMKASDVYNINKNR